MLCRFHRPPELPLQLLQLLVDRALGLPPGQTLGWIAGFSSQCVGCLQQGTQLVGPQPTLGWGVLFRQIAAEGRLVPGAAAIGPQQQQGSQTQQQGDAGTYQHGTLTHSSRRRASGSSMDFETRGCPSGAIVPSRGLGRSTAAQPGVRRVQH